MSTIAVTAQLSLSEKAQKQALLAGFEAKSTQFVSFSIPAKYIDDCTIQPSGAANLLQLCLRSIDSPGTLYISDDIAEISDGCLYMERWEAENAKHAVKNKQRLFDFAEVIQRNKAAIAALVNCSLPEGVVPELISLSVLQRIPDLIQGGHSNPRSYYTILTTYLDYGHFPTHLDHYFDAIKTEPWFDPLMQTVNALRDSYTAEQALRTVALERYRQECKEKEAVQAIAKKEAAAAKEKAVKEGEKKLIAWAKDHGSERIKLMIELNVGDVAAMAEAEFVDVHCPAGFSRKAYNDYASGGERKRPTVAELQALKELTALQSLHPEVYVDIWLVWARYNGEGVEGDYRQALLEVDILTPNLEEISVAMPFPETRLEG